jgi:predicted NBD/HSP70 family sugar kinase
MMGSSGQRRPPDATEGVRLRPGGPSAGHFLELIRTGRARTRRDLLEITGLSRSAVAARVGQLVAAGYVNESGVEAGVRGRPATLLAFDEGHGAVLAADLGATHARAAVCDLAGRTLGEVQQGLRISDGPDVVLGWLESSWRDLLASRDLAQHRIVGLGIGVPGPIDIGVGRPIRPPIMPGWHDYPLRERLEQAFGVPGFVENDANVMALGEFHSTLPSCPSLLFVKVATGIGAGMVVDGRLVRGIHGGSGDIGHVRLANPESGPLCACGARGCLAASASGGAIARRLREQGRSVESSREAVALANDRDPAAVALIREAGMQLGGVLATAVSLLNPQVLMIGGDLVEAHEHFMVSLKESLYQRTQPLATRDLQVLTSSLGDRAGVVGAARLIVEDVFSAESVDHRLAGQDGTLGSTGTAG